MTSSFSRRDPLAAGGASVLAGLGGCATSASPWPAGSVAALAPTGRLRACINYGNPVLARRDAAGQPMGVSVDLARRLAAELGAPVELTTVDSAGRSVQVVKSGEADVGFFAIDPRRSDGIRFTAPYVLIEGAYLVRSDSPLHANAEVDRAGTRVVVGKDSVYDLWLTRELKAARIERAPTSPRVVDEFVAERADLAAACALAAFVERAKASGFVADALARSGIQGALVAPLAG